MSGIGFLSVPKSTSSTAQALFDDDLAEVGYVMNASRLWAYQAETFDGLFDLMRKTITLHGFDLRQRGILVTACASTMGDSYCSLSWAGKLAEASDVQTAAAVLRGTDDVLTPAEKVLARWARQLARDPNATTASDVQALRDAGYTDAQIFGATVFVALRIAFSTVNDALGAQPDAALRTSLPQAVLDSVTFGRAFDNADGGRRTGDQS